MAQFKYDAIGTDGRTVSGRLEAASKTECVAELRKRNLTPLDVQEKGGRSSKAPAPRTPEPPPGAPAAGRKAPAATAPKTAKGKGGVRKKEEVVLFTRQLATMIAAGIPMLESLEILKEQAE